MISVERILNRLDKRAMHQEAAADRQSPRHGEYAERCRVEAEFYRDVMDCIGQLQAEAISARMGKR
jgi:hypothetical protein